MIAAKNNGGAFWGGSSRAQLSHVFDVSLVRNRKEGYRSDTRATHDANAHLGIGPIQRAAIASASWCIKMSGCIFASCISMQPVAVASASAYYKALHLVFALNATRLKRCGEVVSDLRWSVVVVCFVCVSSHRRNLEIFFTLCSCTSYAQILNTFR